MSPLAIRRYRADRLLQAEFRQLQARVIGIVRGRVGATRSGLDEADLEACYALAWQGLYAAVLEGQEISNPTGWLVLATYRRAIDEQRARVRAQRETAPERPQDPDLASALDDRERLRQLFEGLRGRLGRQERQAAVLCYLHGFTRSEAAARMGISERRMRRLMEGRGPGHPGVAEKLGALATNISEGRWCEQQGSLMRGLAFGILDREGERYRLALAHSDHCSACRSYVASLRGLASVLPPVLMPGGLGAAVLARVGEGAAATGAHAGAAAGTSGGAAGGTLGGGSSAPFGGGGVLGGTGAAGAGGAGGGWILAGGPFGAKLAAGCLLALGVGAGCVGIGGLGQRAGQGSRHASHHTGAAGRQPGLRAHGASTSTAVPSDLVRASGSGVSAPAGALTASGQARAAREFGPEQALAAGTPTGGGASGSAASASAASVRASGSRSRATRATGGNVRTPGAGTVEGAGTSQPAGEASTPAASTGVEVQSSQAAREFSPG